jgi:hypothetical protein
MLIGRPWIIICRSASQLRHWTQIGQAIAALLLQQDAPSPEDSYEPIHVPNADKGSSLSE